MTKSFYSFSFGCRVNAAEMEVLDRQLIERGFILDSNNPSVFIINTCAVTAKAEREARQLIYQLDKKLPRTKLIVTGCAATKWINEAVKIKSAELIDNPNKEFIADIIQKRFFPKSRLPTSNYRLYNSKYLSSGRLLVKIQDGCSHFCTFCIVPYLRGQPKSRKITEIIEQINSYNSQTKEVILTAINTQAFGYDSGENFLNLVERVLKNTQVPRISFGSIHPWSVTDEFLDFYKKILPLRRLVNFFHIPLQSGSNKILGLMRRGYTREEFEEKLSTLAKINPLAFIGTDVIVGFLEESDSDFQDSYNFLKKSPISKFHLFRFSPREKTAAYYMKKRLKNIPDNIKKKRVQALLKLSQNKYRRFLSKLIGKKFSALIINKNNHLFNVLLDNQIPVLINSSNHLQPGVFINVSVEALKENKLIARII